MEYKSIVTKIFDDKIKLIEILNERISYWIRILNSRLNDDSKFVIVSSIREFSF